MEDKNYTVHFNTSNGSQVNIAKDNATIHAPLNNGVSANELDNIIKEIMNNLSDFVDMAKEELKKPEPKVSRLKNCLTLIAPMFTIANGIPVLADNLQKLIDYITPYIH